MAPEHIHFIPVQRVRIYSNEDPDPLAIFQVWEYIWHISLYRFLMFPFYAIAAGKNKSWATLFELH
jgi:hypothetical protein